MQSGKVIGTILLGVVLINFDGGCAHSRTSGNEMSAQKLYAVTAESTAFYSHSPQQAHGPDQSIPRDTPMAVIRSAPEFSKVQLLTTEKGYVASKDIAVASPRVIASFNNPGAALASSSAWRAELPQPRPSASEPPLPEFEPTPLPQTINPGN